MTWNPFKGRCPGLAYLAPLLDAAKSRMAAAPFRDRHSELILMFAFFFLSFYYIECPSWQGTCISRSFATGTRRTFEVCFLEAPWPDCWSNSGLESDGHRAMSPDQQSQIIIIIIIKKKISCLTPWYQGSTIYMMQELSFIFYFFALVFAAFIRVNV